MDKLELGSAGPARFGGSTKDGPDVKSDLERIQNFIDDRLREANIEWADYKTNLDLVYKCHAIAKHTAPDIVNAWEGYDATASLSKSHHAAHVIAFNKDEKAVYEAHMAAENAKRAMEMSGLDPALGRYGLPNTMTGKYAPLRDNRDDEPVRSKYR